MQLRCNLDTILKQFRSTDQDIDLPKISLTNRLTDEKFRWTDTR